MQRGLLLFGVVERLLGTQGERQRWERFLEPWVSGSTASVSQPLVVGWGLQLITHHSQRVRLHDVHMYSRHTNYRLRGFGRALYEGPV